MRGEIPSAIHSEEIRVVKVRGVHKAMQIRLTCANSFADAEEVSERKPATVGGHRCNSSAFKVPLRRLRFSIDCITMSSKARELERTQSRGFRVSYLVLALLGDWFNRRNIMSTGHSPISARVARRAKQIRIETNEDDDAAWVD